jgi:NAD-dependent SIR2 family protein deacetylase
LSAEPYFFNLSGGIKMNSCMRCGEKMAHNYLVTIFTTIKEERKKLIVCLKCKEILNEEVK